MDLPPNLYESAGYYSWRNPRTGKKYGIGRDKAHAISEARAANAHLQSPRLIDRAHETPTGTLGQYIPIYQANLIKRNLSKVTMYNRTSSVRAIAAHLGNVPIGMRQEDTAIITRRCAEFLRTYNDAGKDRMAKFMRSILIDIFADMAATWGLPVNPAKALKLPPAKVKRSRLSLEQFQSIYAQAEATADPWVCRALELAIVTLQRRSDVAAMKFRDVQDARLHVIQSKTGARLRIPLALRLQPLGWSLAAIIDRCKDGIFAPRLIHHQMHNGKAKPGMAVHPQTLATEFARCRDLAGIAAEEGKAAPSFHEIRSLGARLYEQSGYDPQHLLGHKDAETTMLYLDKRAVTWIEVAA